MADNTRIDRDARRQKPAADNDYPLSRPNKDTSPDDFDIYLDEGSPSREQKDK